MGGANYIQGAPSFLLIWASPEMPSGFTQKCVSYVTPHPIKLTMERNHQGA